MEQGLGMCSPFLLSRVLCLASMTATQVRPQLRSWSPLSRSPAPSSPDCPCLFFSPVPSFAIQKGNQLVPRAPGHIPHGSCLPCSSASCWLPASSNWKVLPAYPIPITSGSNSTSVSHPLRFGSGITSFRKPS